MKGRIYFAGPLFCKGERDFNQCVAKVFEDAGYEVFLPQRDGYEASSLRDISEEEKVKLIFNEDVSALLGCDVLVMNLDGRVPDDGACVELGMAYIAKKRCYGIKTDVRSIEMGLDLNPMLAGCFIKIFKNFDGDQLLEQLKDYLKTNQL